MKLAVDDEMKVHLQQIINKQITLEAWAEVEASDWFQSENYCGGFDGTELEFAFSHAENGREYWFQFPLSAVPDAVSSPDFRFIARLADR